MSDMNVMKQTSEARSGRVPLVRMVARCWPLAVFRRRSPPREPGLRRAPSFQTTKNSTYGTILVSGKTVYTLKASKVACTAGCLKVWPELLLPKGATKPTAGPGVNAASLGTVAGSGGSRQVTYGGKRLYWFVADSAPGQVNGNITDKWGKWTVVVTVKPAHSSSAPVGRTSAGSGGVSF